MDKRKITKVRKKRMHPRGLYILSGVEMWERFSYYGMLAILALFMTHNLFYSKADASLIYGLYSGTIYLTPLLGGYIADRFIGNRKSVILGGVMMALGQFILAFSASLISPTNANLNTIRLIFILGLIFLIFGNGFIKPTLTSMVTFLYKENDERINSGFNIYYMGINIGALLAPITIGLIAQDNPLLFKWGFIIAGIGMIIGVITFLCLKNKYLVNPDGNPIGKTPQSTKNNKLSENELDTAILKKFEYKDEVIKKEKEKLKKITLKEKEKIFNSKLTIVEKHRILVIIILSFFSIFFNSAFQQAGTSLTFFTESEVNRTLITGITIPTSAFQSIDPLFIILLAPIFAMLWPMLHRKNKEPDIATKSAIGLIILAIGFLVLSIPGNLVDNGTTGVSMMWIILLYLILATGEMFILPTGQSTVAKLSPIKYSSLLMGIWLASTAISNILAGILTRLYYPEPGKATTYFLGILPINGFCSFFLVFALTATISGIIIFLLRKKIKVWMHGIV